MSSRPDPVLRPDKQALFLDREVYQRRRRMDAARFLPIVALILFVLPGLIVANKSGSAAWWLIYFLGVWAILVIGCALIAKRLGPEREAGSLPREDGR